MSAPGLLQALTRRDYGDMGVEAARAARRLTPAVRARLLEVYEGAARDWTMATFTDYAEARDAAGTPCPAFDRGACRWCVLGRVMRAVALPTARHLAALEAGGVTTETLERHARNVLHLVAVAVYDRDAASLNDQRGLEAAAAALYLAHGLLLEVAAAARTPAAAHRQDADCVGWIDGATDTCTVCHVVGGEPCATCGGERYHDDACETITRTRVLLAGRAPCAPDCPGWTIASVDRDPSLEVQVCDACFHGAVLAAALTDDDVAVLPEARRALEAAAAAGRCAP